MTYDSKTLDRLATDLIAKGEGAEDRVHVGRMMEVEIGWEGEDEDRHQVPVTYMDDEALDVPEVRHIEALDLHPAPKPVLTIAPMPQMRIVYPESLQVEASYQRDLSAGSVTLIRKIVNGWDWAKFKPPICAETKVGLFIIDGQHTAIAAMTRGIKQIPVMVVRASEMPERAKAFISHNRDRLRMHALQVFHAEVAGGDPAAIKLLELSRATGAKIPRSAPPKGRAKPGVVLPVGELQAAIRTHGASVVERVLRIAVGARLAPLDGLTARALVRILTVPIYRDVARMKDSALSNAVLRDLDVKARAYGVQTDQPRLQSAAILIAEEARRRAAA